MINFEPITKEKQDKYLSYFEKTEQKSSDYTFINLFGLKDIYRLRWAFTDNLVWIEQGSPYKVLWAPIGNWQDLNYISNCLCDFPTKSLVRIPKSLALLLEKNKCISISQMRDEWEYIYDREQLVNLSGNKFHKKKNLYNQFNKLYSAKYHSIDISWIDKLREFEKKWYENEMASNNAEDVGEVEIFDSQRIASHEVRAEADMVMINTIFDNWQDIRGIKGGLLTVDEQIVAYTMACGTMGDTLVVHTERADRQYKGAYQAINKYFLANDGMEYKFVNREQDVGDEGLRKAKMSYNPVGFVEKYSAYCNMK